MIVETAIVRANRGKKCPAIPQRDAHRTKSAGGLVVSPAFVPWGLLAGLPPPLSRRVALASAGPPVLSAVNALALGPALTALLLKPRDKGTAPPLPRVAFPILGGWLGWEFLAPWLERPLGPLPLPLPGWAAEARPWLPVAAAVLVGVL